MGLLNSETLVIYKQKLSVNGSYNTVIEVTN